MNKSLTNEQRYEIAMKQQAHRSKMREMFKAKPNSCEHTIKVIAADRLRVDIKLMQEHANSVFVMPAGSL